MKAFIVLSTFAAMSTIAIAQPKHSADEAQIRRVNQELFRAFNTLDVRAFERIFTEDAIFSNGGEHINTRADLLSALPKIRRQKFTPIAHTNIFRVNVHGDSAVVVGRAWRPSKNNGGERTIFTHIFVKRNGKWRIAEAISQDENP